MNTDDALHFDSDAAHDGQRFSLESVRDADHPAIARAVAEILSADADSSGFSSFTSHSSAVSDSDE